MRKSARQEDGESYDDRGMNGGSFIDWSADGLAGWVGKVGRVGTYPCRSGPAKIWISGVWNG